MRYAMNNNEVSLKVIHALPAYERKKYIRCSPIYFCRLCKQRQAYMTDDLQSTRTCLAFLLSQTFIFLVFDCFENIL